MPVLTRGESIDNKTDVQRTPEDYKQLDIFENEIKSLSENHTLKGSPRYEVIGEKDNVTADPRQEQAKHRELRITMPSHMIVPEMQALYLELTDDTAPLPVFCVGSAAYKQLQMSLRTAAPRRSGAPTVQVCEFVDGRPCSSESLKQTRASPSTPEGEEYTLEAARLYVGLKTITARHDDKVKTLRDDRDDECKTLNGRKSG